MKCVLRHAFVRSTVAGPLLGIALLASLGVAKADQDSSAAEQFAARTKAAIVGQDWAPKVEYLDQALLAAVKEVPVSPDPGRYDTILDDPTLSTMLAPARYNKAADKLEAVAQSSQSKPTMQGGKSNSSNMKSM